MQWRLYTIGAEWWLVLMFNGGEKWLYAVGEGDYPTGRSTDCEIIPFTPLSIMSWVAVDTN